MTKKTKNMQSNKGLTRLTWIIIVLGFLATIVVWLTAKPLVQKVESIPDGFSIQGVAINQTSGYVDYHNLATNGIDFVYLRATTGDSFTDDGYKSSYKRATAENLKVGSIQVYDVAVDASTQAQYFINHVGNRVGQLPIAIYVTDDQITTQTSKDRLVTLIQILAAHYSKDIIIYTTPTVQNKLSNTVKNTKYWLIEDNTDDKSDKNQFIQYSEDHTVGSGLKAVKMQTSVFNGTTAEFKRLK